MQFQHFRQFINHKIDQLKNQTSARDLFDREVMFYDEGTYIHVHTEKLYSCIHVHVHILHDGIYTIYALVYSSVVERSVYSVQCRGFESHQWQLIFLGKVTALGVLCCFALLFV